MSNFIVHMSIDDYLELVERAKAKGIQEGESMQEALDEMIAEGRIERLVKTERPEDQIIEDLQKHWKVKDLRGFYD